MGKRSIAISIIILAFIAEFSGYIARPFGGYAFVVMMDVFAFIALLYWWVIRDSVDRNMRIGPGLRAHIILMPLTGLPSYFVRSRGAKSGVVATVLAAGVLVGSVISAALGQSAAHHLYAAWWKETWQQCTGKDVASPDLRIDGCSALIQSDWMHARKNIAVAYYNRGTAYHAKGEYERAITNYDHAVRHNPEFAKAFFARGSAYSHKGEREHSMADFTTAIRLDGMLIPVICRSEQSATVRITGCP